MNATTARAIACESHRGQLGRHGLPLIDHVERVAAGVPDEAKAIAYLHEVLAYSDTTLDRLVDEGLTPDEAAAVVLLTRQPGESYEAWILRVAYAKGLAGMLARKVEIADLDDHLQLPREVGEPPYGWARQHMLVCSARYDSGLQAA
jgi:hypothetical protein